MAVHYSAGFWAGRQSGEQGNLRDLSASVCKVRKAQDGVNSVN